MFISISTKRDVALVLGVANFLCNHRAGRTFTLLVYDEFVPLRYPVECGTKLYTKLLRVVTGTRYHKSLMMENARRRDQNTLTFHNVAIVLYVGCRSFI